MSAGRRVRVGIVVGSATDLPVMEHCGSVLDGYGIGWEVGVMSAHRAPELVREYGLRARDRGLDVLVAAAGGAAHLPGVVAAHTTLPVIGVPIASTGLQGIDSLLSIVQMPAGIPVATVAIGEPGARNAGHLAAQIIAVTDTAVAGAIQAARAAMREKMRLPEGFSA